MKKLLSTLIIIGAIYTNEIASQDVEEVIVVTSALIDETEITNPLYVIDLQNADSKVSELIQTSFVEELTPDDSSLKNTSNYLSRAPPKK